MVRVGVTGGSGAGKGEVSKILSQLTGWTHINSDAVYHELRETNVDMRDELLKEFGTLKITQISERLNEITHKYIIQAIEEKCGDNSTNGVIIDAPLLIESGFDKTCDKTVAVVANRETRINRIMLRDGLTREQAETRLSAQHDNVFYSENTDITIKNDGSREELKKECEQLSKRLLKF